LTVSQRFANRLLVNVAAPVPAIEAALGGKIATACASGNFGQSARTIVAISYFAWTTFCPRPSSEIDDLNAAMSSA
jgi:hypothetical protein